MSSDIEHLAALKDEFIASVSHELRTPLTIVMTGIDSLRGGLAGALTPKQHSVVALCQRNVLRLNKMIDNLLDISRLESGAAVSRMRRVSLGPLAAKAAARARTGRGKTVKVETVAPLPDVRADAKLLAQALDMLLDNAVRFAANEVRLSLRPVRGFFEGRAADGVRIQVSDDGPGIPPDRVAQLFNKFTQVARAAGGGYNGTGLGLAICKEILVLHGTTVVVVPSARGACFQFFLPAWQEAAASGRRPGRIGGRRHG